MAFEFKEIVKFIELLPRAAKDEVEGKLAYRVGKKIFVVFDKEKNALLTKTTKKKLGSFLAKAGFFEPIPIDSKPYWVGVELNARTEISLLKDLIIDGFHLVANKKALDKLYSEFPL